MAKPDLRAAQRELDDRVMGEPGVEGTAIGRADGGVCLKVYVSSEDAGRVVPETVRGIPVLIEVSGPFRRR